MVTVLAMGSAMASAPALSFDQRHGIITGPITAEVIRVLDGDTVEVKAYPWPQQSIDILVRLRGIDAPEIHGKCALEREQAARAADRLQRFVQNEPKVLLTDIGGDKYFGRVVANLGLPDGSDAASALILENLVRPYDGGKKQQPSC